MHYTRQTSVTGIEIAGEQLLGAVDAQAPHEIMGRFAESGREHAAENGTVRDTLRRRRLPARSVGEAGGEKISRERQSRPKVFLRQGPGVGLQV